MGYLINGYKIMGQETKGYIQKHRAGIGTVVSIGGTIVSNILSTRAGAKSARIIDAKQMELGRPLTVQEKVKYCWQNHISSGIVAGVSCIGAGYSHNQHVKDFNKVAMAYSGIKKLYDGAKTATREVLGEKKDIELQDKLNKKYLEEHPEVKKKIINTTDNPDPSTMQKFWEPTSGEVFFCSVDKIELAIKTMNAEMKALKPRDPKNTYYRCGSYGIKLIRFFDLIDHQLSTAAEQSLILQHFGWNKGKENEGSDDEIISASYSPMMINEDKAQTCAAINWAIDPSDMRYGDYIKS